ncbi:MAG: hypothetical protein CVV27_02380 [Candidatus Melainabacteria bacterium HGW-Melainabacteria-1]|nr:MAG: hypothetical protein CVV27_02380 [Candidatus Melainabacteria bacterium HGW-Melainabacteria-1]
MQNPDNQQYAINSIPEGLTEQEEREYQALILDSDPNEDGNISGLLKKHWLVVLIILGLWIGLAAAAWTPFLSSIATEKTAQLGDTFGSVNALFSGLAFAFVVITLNYQITQLKLQRKEITMQRFELKLQRKEMHNQFLELQKQSQEMLETRLEFKVQRLNDVFFNLLVTKRTALTSLIITVDEVRFHGEKALEAISSKLVKNLSTLSEEEDLMDLTGRVLKSYDADLDRYVKSLNSILDTIELSGIDTEAQSGYIRLLEYNLSYHELIFIGFMLIGFYSMPLNFRARTHKLMFNLTEINTKLTLGEDFRDRFFELLDQYM